MKDWGHMQFLLLLTFCGICMYYVYSAGSGVPW